MSRRPLIALASAIAATIALAGCSGDDSSKETPEASATTTAAETTSAAPSDEASESSSETSASADAGGVDLEGVSIADAKLEVIPADEVDDTLSLVAEGADAMGVIFDPEDCGRVLFGPYGDLVDLDGTRSLGINSESGDTVTVVSFGAAADAAGALGDLKDADSACSSFTISGQAEDGSTEELGDGKAEVSAVSVDGADDAYTMTATYSLQGNEVKGNQAVAQKGEHLIVITSPAGASDVDALQQAASDVVAKIG